MGAYAKFGPWSRNSVKCGIKSPFVNLDFTQQNISQKRLGTDSAKARFALQQADEEFARPNYMTTKTCRGGGCAPCDKNLTDPTADGCLVPMKTGLEEWFGMSTEPNSDLTMSSANVQFKCDHKGQRIPIHFYAEGVENGQVSLYVNDEPQNLTSMQHSCMQGHTQLFM